MLVSDQYPYRFDQLVSDVGFLAVVFIHRLALGHFKAKYQQQFVCALTQEHSSTKDSQVVTGLHQTLILHLRPRTNCNACATGCEICLSIFPLSQHPGYSTHVERHFIKLWVNRHGKIYTVSITKVICLLSFTFLGRRGNSGRGTRANRWISGVYDYGWNGGSLFTCCKFLRSVLHSPVPFGRSSKILTWSTIILYVLRVRSAARPMTWRVSGKIWFGTQNRCRHRDWWAELTSSGVQC